MIAKLQPSEPPQYLLLHDISWHGYEVMAQELQERNYRLTYDDGWLEFRVVTHEHARQSELLGTFFWMAAFELHVPIHSGGSTTFNDKRHLIGLEPDKCYWIQNEAHMRGKKAFIVNRDPPPDVALEIDINRSALDRMGIYAALRVPEVWRYDGGNLRVFHLTVRRKYVERMRSRSLPLLPINGVPVFLRKAYTVDETTLLHSYVAWIREELAPTMTKPYTTKPAQNGKHREK